MVPGHVIMAAVPGHEIMAAVPGHVIRGRGSGSCDQGARFRVT